jgi:uncharacterized repeat protein (TIGR01451 family)
MEGVVTADLGAIPGGQSATVTVVVAVPSGFSGTLTNTAAATSAENDVDPQNNSIMLVTPVALQADLAVMKTGDVEPIVPGQTLTYSVQVTNSGPSDATGVTLTDMLPACVTFVSATSSQGDPPTQSAGVVTANLGGLAAGATATVTIQVTVNSSTTGTLENTATVTSPTPDANVENNSAVESTEVTPEVNLEVVKADSLDPVTSGQMLTYTLTVTNNGPADATGVILTDTLPTGVSFASATASQGDPPMALEGVVTVALGNLAAGGSATVTIVVDVGRNTFGPITNTASVTASEPETDPADNMASQTTEVELAPASLSGFVFVDFDNNGLFDGRDVPIPGVTILLTGTDLTGAMVSRTTRTIEDGSYLFEDLLPGIYRIEEVQPGFFPDGQETVGTAGGVAQDNVFEMIDLMGGIDGEGYNFAELVPRLTKRDFLASSARPG